MQNRNTNRGIIIQVVRGQKARQKRRREVSKSKKEEEAHGRCFDLSSESKSIKFLKKPERKMQRLLTLDFWLLL